MSARADSWPKFICMNCAKVISSQPFGRCQDCGGEFREATDEDLQCGRCNGRRGYRLARREQYDRLCENCITELNLREEGVSRTDE